MTYIMFTVHPERGESSYEVEDMHTAMEAFTHFVIMANQHGEYNRAEVRSKNRDGSFRILVAFDHNGLGEINKSARAQFSPEQHHQYNEE